VGQLQPEQRLCWAERRLEEPQRQHRHYYWELEAGQKPLLLISRRAGRLVAFPE
jgi:hypothetical protein